MRVSPSNSHDYLECPSCGARYLLAEPLDGNRRWFDCRRCEKRVRSATPYVLGTVVTRLDPSDEAAAG